MYRLMLKHIKYKNDLQFNICLLFKIINGNEKLDLSLSMVILNKY